MMKPILFLVITFFMAQYSAAQVEQPPLSPQEIRMGTFFRPNPLIGDHQCAAGTVTKSLDRLEIMGASIASLEPGIAVQGCVMARNTSEAFSRCGNSFNILNLSNAQYDEELEDKLYTGTQRETPFYCIQNRYRMATIKSTRCSQLQSNENYARLFRFRMTTDGDGSCQVQEIADGTNGPWRLHNERLERMIRDERYGPSVPISILSADEIITTTPDPSALLASLPPINIGEDIDTKLNTCIARWRDRANLCKSGADDVLRTCSENRVDAAASAPLPQTNGTQQTLFESGARLSATGNTLDRQITSCTAGQNFCQTSCNSDLADQMIADCVRDAGQSSESQFRTTYPELSATLQSAQVDVRGLFGEGRRICTTQASTQRTNLNNALTTVLSAIRTAAVGVCQTSTSNGQNCNQIPTIPDCQNTPGLAGCNIYSQMDSCAVGSVYYNAAACACAKNPTSCSPATTNTAATVSNFAGNLAGASVQPSTGGSSSFAGGGGGGSSGGGSFSDLSMPGGGGTAVPANFANNIKAGETSSGGAGATGASVGGGGGNGSAGLAGNPADPARAPAEKGLGALFKDIKNVVSNAFGGSSRSAPSSAQKANGAVDVNRFKPNTKLRGGPIQRDVASANEKTLFELINDCANGLRCKNSGDLLVNP